MGIADDLVIDPTKPATVLVKPRRIRALIIGALVLLPVAAIEWPWGFLPIRWQYSEIRDAEQVIAIIEDLRTKSGRLPTTEALRAALQQRLIPTDYDYDAQGDGYTLMATGWFDWSVVYDSRTRTWRRSP